jgi:hypothetical protein
LLTGIFIRRFIILHFRFIAVQELKIQYLQQQRREREREMRVVVGEKATI